MNRPIHITDVGKQVALSGLLPQTVHEFLAYVVRQRQSLANFLKRDSSGVIVGRQNFDFCLLFASLSSSEFDAGPGTRNIHYGLKDMASNPMVDAHVMLLSQNPWQPYRSAANGSMILLDWINGVPISGLEGRFKALRAGRIQALARDAAWCLTGFSEILAAATKQDSTPEERPLAFRNLSANDLGTIRSLIPSMRLLAWRLNVGFPAEILWMAELKDGFGRISVSRSEAVALYNAGLYSYSALRQRSNWPGIIKALLSAVGGNTQTRAEEIQKLAHARHEVVRSAVCEKLIQQIPEAKDRINEFFSTRDIPFQTAFENLLNLAGIRFTLFDNGDRRGAFDYIIHVPDRQDFIVECKTKQKDALVDMGEARTVLGAAVQHGFNSSFCVTLCNPGINPDVLADFCDCSLLGIAEAHDMATALIRVATGKLTPQGFHDWLVQPGLAKAENIYAYSYRPEIVATIPALEIAAEAVEPLS